MSKPVIDKLREWRRSPLIFVQEVIGATPSTQQIELLQAFPKNKRTTVRSGHGTGKDAVASWLILNFMITRPYAKVVCTAPTARQLGDILWSELSKWIRKSDVLQDEFVVQKDKIFHKSAPKEWWIRAVSTSVKDTAEDQAETLAGFHADHLLIVVDESSGVPDPVFVPLEGALTQEDNRVLLIGNMTRNNGYFYDTHFHSEIKKQWTRLHWDSRESTNVSKEMIEYFRKKYGEDSNIFRIRVVGDPPTESERTLIPLSWAQQCIGNEIAVPEDEPIYLGVDVARYGEDKSIILPRQGNLIMPWESFHGMNTISLGGFIRSMYAEMDASGIAIDEIGVGAGVTDWLQKHDQSRSKVFGINVSNKSSDRKKYSRLRDELWCAMRDKCQNATYSFPDVKIKIAGIDVHLGEELCNELASPSYDFDNEGAIVVESKKKMKMRGIASPNIADALGLTEYFHHVVYKLWGDNKKKTRNSRSRGHESTVPARDRWMVA